MSKKLQIIFYYLKTINLNLIYSILRDFKLSNEADKLTTSTN